MAKPGTRKYGCVLINQGDKVTPAEKLERIEENRRMYGLSQEYIDYIKLPKAHNVKIYDIDKIIYSKKKLSALEKIDHLQDMKEALMDKMKTL